MERLYGEKGFTNKVKEMLQPYIWDLGIGGNCLHFVEVPREVLLEVAKFLPEEQMGDRQNYSPTLKEILEDDLIAFCDGYIILESREDERLTVDTIYYPATEEGYKRAIEVGIAYDPDELSPVRVEGSEMIRLWWD